MKSGSIAVTFFLCLLAAATAPSSWAADGTPFEPTTFKLQVVSPALEVPKFERLAPDDKDTALARVTGIRIDLPVGPVRIDYGVPVPSGKFRDSGNRFNRIDFPGPGYRRLKGEK